MSLLRHWLLSPKIKDVSSISHYYAYPAVTSIFCYIWCRQNLSFLPSALVFGYSFSSLKGMSFTQRYVFQESQGYVFHLSLQLSSCLYFRSHLLPAVFLYVNEGKLTELIFRVLPGRPVRCSLSYYFILISYYLYK